MIVCRRDLSMHRRGLIAGLVLLEVVLCAPMLSAGNPEAAVRGEKALTGRALNPPAWSAQAYRNAWRRWDGTRSAPSNYAQAFREHYGLHTAPYPNGDYPMGLREAKALLGKGITTDCLLCHAG